MLNRTNRMLSAHLNRLNLGTRSLAYFAGVNTGEQTLRTRHAHRVVMRDGIPGDQPRPSSWPTGEIPGIPSSPDGSPRLIVNRVIPPVVQLVEVPPHAGRSCRRGESQDPAPKRVERRRAAVSRKSKTDLWLSREDGRFAGVTLSRASFGPRAALSAARGG